MHSHAFIRTHMPYLLQQTSDGCWIALNRNYKPVGTVDSRAHVDYDTHPSRMRIKPENISYLRRITAHLADYGDASSPDCVYLYTVACAPTGDKKFWGWYAKVLQRLAAVTHEFDPQRDAGVPRTLETEAERLERIERERG